MQKRSNDHNKEALLNAFFPEIEKYGVCCVCFHDLSHHIDEGEGWRCHWLGRDGYQCECYLRKDKDISIKTYDLKARIEEHRKELNNKI